MKRLFKTMAAFALLILTAFAYDISSAGTDRSCSCLSAPVMKLFAQEAAYPVKISATEQDLATGASPVLYQVMGVVLIIWFGLALFLFKINRNVSRLEKSLSEKPGNK